MANKKPRAKWVGCNRLFVEKPEPYHRTALASAEGLVFDITPTQARAAAEWLIRFADWADAMQQKGEP